MPFAPGPDGRPILVCINLAAIQHEHAEVNGSTMHADNAWNVMPGSVPPRRPATAAGAIAYIPPRMDFGRGQTVRCYCCTVCGYTELYDAGTIDPILWREGP
jgi:hypothetical protein